VLQIIGHFDEPQLLGEHHRPVNDRADLRFRRSRASMHRPVGAASFALPDRFALGLSEQDKTRMP